VRPFRPTYRSGTFTKETVLGMRQETVSVELVECYRRVSAIDGSRLWKEPHFRCVSTVRRRDLVLQPIDTDTKSISNLVMVKRKMIGSHGCSRPIPSSFGSDTTVALRTFWASHTLGSQHFYLFAPPRTPSSHLIKQVSATQSCETATKNNVISRLPRTLCFLFNKICCDSRKNGQRSAP
jgi:hypothetical protein